MRTGSGERNLAVVGAMTVMMVMTAAAYEVIGVASVGHLRMPAIRPVRMISGMTWTIMATRADRRVLRRDAQGVLVDVVVLPMGSGSWPASWQMTAMNKKTRG